MAQNLLRLGRPLTASLRSLSSTSLLSSSLPRSSPLSSSSAAVAQSSPRRALEFQPQSRSFRSSSFSSARPPSIYNNQNDEIGPDTILFEGCDYNHWLIVMDFPKGENKPPPEEMVRTYEETCARGLNISVEEAKKKIYACSTTTYTGFQVLMTEEESTKFEGVPGVIFILPDSYIDPQNKEYGGDKYENGHITPRPPPFQYERQGSRFRDCNRFDRQGPYQQGNSSYGRQEPPPRTPQNYPPQTYGPPGQGENRGHSPVNSPVGRDAYQPGRDSIPPNQGNYNQRVQSNSPQGDQSTYAPPGYGQAAPSSGAHGGYGPGASTGGYGPGASTGGYGPGASTGGYGPGASTGGYGPGASTGGYGPGASTGGYGPGARTGGYGPGLSTGSYGPGASTGGYGPGASTGGYGPGPSAGGYGPGPSAGGYGPGPSTGGYGPGPSAGGYGPGPSAGGFGQGPIGGASGQGPIPGTLVQGPGFGYPGNGDQGFTQGEQSRLQGEQTNSAYVGRTGTDQGRY